MVVQASLDYRVSSRTARATQRNPVLKTNKLTNKDFRHEMYNRHVQLDPNAVGKI